MREGLFDRYFDKYALLISTVTNLLVKSYAVIYIFIIRHISHRSKGQEHDCYTIERLILFRSTNTTIPFNAFVG